MPRKLTYTIGDFSRELSTFAINVAPATTDTQLGEIFDAVAPLTIGVVQRVTDSNIEAVSNIFPPSVDAQRERAIEIAYQDDVTLKKYRTSIPCATFSGVAFIGQTDELDMTDAPLSTFVTKFESYGRSEAGNAITVLSARAIGRNS